MKHEKQLSETPWVKNELQALRSEESGEHAINRAVRAMQAPVARRARPSYIWRTVAVAAGIGAVGLVLTATSRSASAAELRQISAAIHAQQNRHDRAFRPDKNGNMVMTNEDWIAGNKQSEVMILTDGSKSLSIYDGHRNYVSYPGEAFIDDVEPSKLPIEDLAAYLSIGGGKLVNHVSRGSTDLYTISFTGLIFDIYIDPSTKLPVSRDVKDRAGHVFEHNVYDYPAEIPDTVFAIPAGGPGVTDYPALRASLAGRISGPGEVKTVAGVNVSLKAVIVGKHRVLALWTGGAKGDTVKGSDMIIENGPRVILGGRPEVFDVNSEASTPLAGREELRGDGAWIEGHRYTGTLKINIAVWVEDRTKPLVLKSGKQAGFHSKMVGRVTYDVKHPIFAADPDRVLFRPDGGVREAGVAKR